MDPLTQISTRHTHQSTQAHPEQAANNAGGYSFQITPAQRLRRFLILGTDSGTYYTSAQELTKDNAQVVIDMARTDHQTLLDGIYAVSKDGIAPKQNPTIFSLAVACSVGSEAERGAALILLPEICRTGTHLFMFAQYVQQFRGWGRALRRAVGDWYTSKPADRLAYQAIKYRQRDGWSHRDMLRLSHPVADLRETRSLFDWITHGATDEHTPRLVEGFLKAQEPDRQDWADLIEAYNLPWEALPDKALNKASTWETLVNQGMPQTALIRQLPRMTRLGVLSPFSQLTLEVCGQLTDSERLRRARVHPAQLLIGGRTYASGRSLRGSSTWYPTGQIVEALDEAFYRSFQNVEPTGKRTMLALDVSGSMDVQIPNQPISAREASTALALVTANVEPNHEIVGFTSGGSSAGWGWRSRYHSAKLEPLQVYRGQRLNDAMDRTSRLPFGGTDCALPMIHAQTQGWEIDTFVIYTDSETWAGDTHPHQALERYRQTTGIDAKLVVVGMTSNGFSIANPKDPGMLDVVGFDTSAPRLISEFSMGF